MLIKIIEIESIKVKYSRDPFHFFDSSEIFLALSPTLLKKSKLSFSIVPANFIVFPISSNSK
jgi:hypothetical protein